MKTVTIYTDGACSGNPGPGGWGAILMYGPHSRELSGGEAATTNNRMELTAVIQALSLLKEPCIVDLWSDSKYVIDGLEKGWAKGWKARGWKKADKKPALNPDLWDRLLALTEVHSIRYHWVKGHAENAYNNRCDELAVAESQKYTKYVICTPQNGAGAVQAVRRRQSHGGVGISSRRANQKNRSPTGSAGRGTMRRAHTATTVMSWWRPEILIAPASFSWGEKVRKTDLSSKKRQVFLNFSAVYENRKKHSQSVHKKNII